MIIPAYNEAGTIAEIVTTAFASALVDEVIVVNDASTDTTAKRAAESGAKVLTLAENRGKGNAMAVGLAAAANEVVLFLDADLIGITTRHVDDLVLPVLNGDVKMTVGKFQSGEFWTTLSQHITPFLSGQRALQKEAVSRFKNMEQLGFGAETALTLFFRKNNLPMKTVLLTSLHHVVKERKFGFFRGFFLRLRMYWQILCVLFVRNF